jgi:hypothetical protein
MQQMPQQMAMQQAMPQGMPSQMGIGALAAQRQQGGQADPRLMAMMQALGGNRPQPAQQTGGMPAGGFSQAEMQYQQSLMPPGMAAPGGAQISAMNFTPRPATMGLDGMPIQRANDPQMLAQMQAMQQQMAPGGMASQINRGTSQPDPQMLAAMQAFQQQGGQGSMPPAGMDPRMAAMQAMNQQAGQGGQNMQSQLQAMGLDGPRSPEQEMQYQQFMQQQPQMTPMGPMTQQQIASMTPAMRQQMTDMQNRTDMQRRLASGDFPGAQGGMPAQRPMPVGAGGKGAGMDPRMINPPRPGLPSTMTNNRRPMTQSQRTQAANPLFAQMMRGGSR